MASAAASATTISEAPAWRTALARRLLGDAVDDHLRLLVETRHGAPETRSPPGASATTCRRRASADCRRDRGRAAAAAGARAREAQVLDRPRRGSVRPARTRRRARPAWARASGAATRPGCRRRPAPGRRRRGDRTRPACAPPRGSGPAVAPSRRSFSSLRRSSTTESRSASSARWRSVMSWICPRK